MLKDNSALIIATMTRNAQINLLVVGQHMNTALRKEISRPGRRGFGKGQSKIQPKLKKRARNRTRGGESSGKRLRSTVRLGTTGKILGISVGSKPGEPPRRQTGFLWRSIAHIVNAASFSVRVGTNVKYGKWLEGGVRSHKVTVKKKKVLANRTTGQIFGKSVRVSMAPRPWVKPTFKRETANALRILSRRLI